MNWLQGMEWHLYKKIKRSRLKNITPTIISSNCNGEYWYYDMKLKFLSPTINLSFDMNDYVKMLENLSWYMKQPVLPYEDKRFDFPTGRIGDIEIRFNHYKTFTEAVYKWEERKKRINWDNHENLIAVGEVESVTVESNDKGMMEMYITFREVEDG